jgi:S1-C subfamily serine protease
MRDYQPGDTATLTVFRGGEERTLDVTLGERPE